RRQCGMSDELLLRAMTEARRVAAQLTEFKSETYTAVLLSELLNDRITNGAAQREEPLIKNGEAVAQEGKQFSAAELFADCKWSSEIDKVIVAGYFLERYSAASAYGLSELRGVLVSAKVPVPKNPS